MEANDTVHAHKDTLWQRIVPPLAGAILIVAFVFLGLWQLDRAAEKEALSALFENDAPHKALDANDIPALYEPIQVRGRLRPDRQVLIDNIVRDGRVGYFVITPLETTVDDRLLLVNRGWLAKNSITATPSAADLATDTEWRTIRGRAGRLPRVGIRSGDAFSKTDDWPRAAVYPNLDEVAAELGQPLWPIVLLLDKEDAEGFQRIWKPELSGPMTHYGYAFQWFALALTVVVIGVWHLRKRLRAA